MSEGTNEENLTWGSSCTAGYSRWTSEPAGGICWVSCWTAVTVVGPSFLNHTLESPRGLCASVDVAAFGRAK